MLKLILIFLWKSKLIFICGFVFQLPVIIYFLGRFKLVTSKKLKKWRKYAFIVILILASIVTPPDVFSQILISIPLFILYDLFWKYESLMYL